MIIRIIEKPITRTEAREIAKEFYGNMVKGVVDVEREIIALGGEWHMDANSLIIESGSRQDTVWGFNFYTDDGRIAYTSLINIRPAQNNRKIEVEDEMLKGKMERIIRKLIVSKREPPHFLWPIWGAIFPSFSRTSKMERRAWSHPRRKERGKLSLNYLLTRSLKAEQKK